LQIFDADLEKVHDDPRTDFGDDAEELKLGETLLIEQQYPIILLPHTTPADCFIGSARRRIAT
jgi:hypothetical protein